MKRFTAALALAFAGTFFLGAQAQAQTAQDQQVRDEIRSMVTGESPAQADRAVVSDFLDRGDVQKAAAERGIDLDRVKDGVATLDASEAASLAKRIQDADAYLAGGDTLVITSTTIIIILLILIFIAVA